MKAINIIPTPSEVIFDGEYINFNQIKFLPNQNHYNFEFENIISFISDGIYRSIFHKKSGIEIILKEDSKLLIEEYEIQINAHSIVFIFSSIKGFRYALSTLLQLIDIGNSKLPICTIKDRPKHNYRGFMLDVSRHFFSINDIKEVIQILYMCKLNNLQLHLSDDQGWRIEIKKYPQLQSIGSIRKCTKNIDGSSDNIPYGGCYSQDDIKELVSYAEKFNVNIIPEIDIPGHSSALLASYPELGNKSIYKVEQDWVNNDNILFPYDHTIKFLKDVFEEIINIFPSKYIHLGGDECNIDLWNDSSDKTIKEKFSNGEEGYSYFINTISELIISKNRIPVVWGEAIKYQKNISKKIIFMTWKKEQDTLNIKNRILAYDKPFYLSYPQNYDDIKQYGSGWINSLTNILNSDFETNILGIQASLWTEYIKNLEEVRYMILPRIYAFAEKSWNPGKSAFSAEGFKVKVKENLYIIHTR